MDGATPLGLTSRRGRALLAATVLASGAVFLEGSVVTVALPAVGRAFGLGIEGLQWVLNAYQLTLTALLLLGGSLGDVYPRRTVLVAGLIGFAATSALAGLAPTLGVLLAARVLQGAAGAILVPTSLAIVESGFAAGDRAAAIGHWAAWSAISTALGPLAGGWLVDALSWRWVYAGVVPWALAAGWLAWRWVPGSEAPAAAGAAGTRRLDWRGALLATLGLAGLTAALVAGPGPGAARLSAWALALGGVALLALFLALERRAPDPLLPLALFRSGQFSGANIVTLLVYTALGALFFLFVLQLENVLGYSAAAAGLMLLPINVLMLLVSPLAGRLASRLGPRWPMSAGSLVCALGLLLLAGVQPGDASFATVLLRVSVFGFGLALLVAPLTAAVLAAVPDADSGIGAGVNNAVARLAGLLATAAVPLAAGLGGLADLHGAALAGGFARAMWIGAGLCLAGAAVALLSARGAGAVSPGVPPSPGHGCVGPVGANLTGLGAPAGAAGG